MFQSRLLSSNNQAAVKAEDHQDNIKKKHLDLKEVKLQTILFPR
jgi:hypothetical protein